MRAPKRRRPLRREFHIPPGVNFDDLLKKVKYIGSCEHKQGPGFNGSYGPRSDASKCPPELELDQVQEWLCAAFSENHVGGKWENGFPRYVWHVANGVCYEGRLVNSGAGEYKGYPLDPTEWPRELRQS